MMRRLVVTRPGLQPCPKRLRLIQTVIQPRRLLTAQGWRPYADIAARLQAQHDATMAKYDAALHRTMEQARGVLDTCTHQTYHTGRALLHDPTRGPDKAVRTWYEDGHFCWEEVDLHASP